MRGKRHDQGSMLRRGGRGRRREADLTGLINVVFLILIFFVVAGALRPFSQRGVELAKVAPETADKVATSRLVVRDDGVIVYRGRRVDIEALAGTVGAGMTDGAGRGAAVFTIVADGRVPARRLLEVTRALKGAGVGAMALMVERRRR